MALLDGHLRAAQVRRQIRRRDVTAGDILAALSPLWALKAEMARRLRGRISAVLRWAVVQ